MAIDIKVSGGVDFNAYLADFAENFDASGRGAFSRGLGGDEYALWESDGLIPPIADGQAFVVDSGAAGDLAYDMETHTVGGTIDSIDFGTGVTDIGGGDFETDSDVLISGLDLESTGGSGIVNELLVDLMGGDTDVLLSILQNSDLNFKGSAGHDAFASFAGDDKISAGDGRDSINGGAGDDKLTGGKGSDLFIFDAGSGDDVIKDFQAGKDKGDVISFTAGQFDNFKDLLASSVTDAKGNTIITIDDDNSITLKGVDVADLHKGDFLFA